MTVTAMFDDDDEPNFDDALYERRLRVLSLRMGGMTYREIATVLKIDPSTARRDEAAAKRLIAGDDMEGIIAGQRAVLADIRKANYRSMLGGDKDATANILKGLDHEAKLLGLYAPTRINTGPSHIEFSERAAELITAVSPDILKELLRGTSIDPRVIAEHEREQEPEPLDVQVVESLPTASDSPADAPEPDSSGPRPDEPADDDWSNI